MQQQTFQVFTYNSHTSTSHKLFNLHFPMEFSFRVTDILYIKFNINLLLLFSRPVSAYALFFSDTQAAIKGQNPNASFGDISKIVASMWDVLSPDNKNVS